MILSLAQRIKRGNVRRLRQNSPLIDFASNDYLGLARSSSLKQQVLEEMERIEMGSLNGLGSTGSRLFTGNTSYAEDLEQSIAQYHGYEAGLLFHCGYLANVGLLSAIARPKDKIFYDTHIHASTRDGIRLSRAEAYPFRHHDVEHLEKRLRALSHKGRSYVCIESVYSMDGSLAPLQVICALCHHYGAQLIVDEAHAVGLFGPGGRGYVAQLGLTDQVFALMLPFGKAMGVFGAIVLGSQVLKEYLINFSRPSIYSTALPLQVLAAIRCAYALLPTLNDERQTLFSRIEQFRSSPSAIQTISVSGNAKVKQFKHFLAKRGYAVNALMSPTVQQGYERLRVSLHAYNTQDEVAELLHLIETGKNNFTGSSGYRQDRTG